MISGRKGRGLLLPRLPAQNLPPLCWPVCPSGDSGEPAGQGEGRSREAPISSCDLWRTHCEDCPSFHSYSNPVTPIMQMKSPRLGQAEQLAHDQTAGEWESWGLNCPGAPAPETSYWLCDRISRGQGNRCDGGGDGRDVQKHTHTSPELSPPPDWISWQRHHPQLSGSGTVLSPTRGAGGEPAGEVQRRPGRRALASLPLQELSALAEPRDLCRAPCRGTTSLPPGEIPALPSNTPAGCSPALAGFLHPPPGKLGHCVLQSVMRGTVKEALSVT